MSPRLSNTTNVSPYLSARGGLAGCVAVMANAVSERASVIGATIFAPITEAGLAVALGDIAVWPSLFGGVQSIVYLGHKRTPESAHVTSLCPRKRTFSQVVT